MYKIVFLDIDGTLYNTKKEIPEKTRESIYRLQKKNIEVVLATGRPFCEFEELANEFQISSYIAMNGGLVVVDGTVIEDRPLSLHTLQEFQALSQKSPYPTFFCGSETIFVLKDEEKAAKKAFEALGWSLYYEPVSSITKPIYQIQFLCPLPIPKAYHQLPEIKLYPWISHGRGADILPETNSKGHGIASFLRHRNLTSDVAMAFGDGNNDLEMMQSVGMGIAMGNGPESLKSVAKFVTKHVDEDGIYWALNHFNLL